MGIIYGLVHLVLLCALVKQLLVHLHEELEGVVDEAMDGLVPVVLTIFIKSREHDR